MTSAGSQVQTAVMVRQWLVAPRHYRMRLRAPQLAAAAAGQFIHVLARTALAADPLLRRAFSIYAVNGEEADIVYRVQGRGTAQMSGWAPGQLVDLLGPLGQPFSLPDGVREVVLVGGGVGVPPLVLLAHQWGAQGIALQALIGARTAEDLIGLTDLQAAGVRVGMATDDGTAGHFGLVTDLLPARLHPGMAVCACGPWPMLRAVAAVVPPEIPCQVSLEEAMPCGIGVCNGCVVAVTQGADAYQRYRRICVEGPVLDASLVDWDHEPGKH